MSKLLVISGPSGVGKCTIVGHLEDMYEEKGKKLYLSISCTTREPREGEKDGVNYHFLSRENFEKKIENSEFLEYSEYCGNYYGTPREYVEKQIAAGKDVILEIEVQGALQIKKKFPNTLLLFVTPPSAKELAQRLRDRHTETDEQIAGRLSRATEEVEWISKYDFLVINDDIERSVDRLNDIIVAAHNVPIRQQEMINEIKKDLEVMTKGEL